MQNREEGRRKRGVKKSNETETRMEQLGANEALSEDITRDRGITGAVSDRKRVQVEAQSFLLFL